MLSFVGSGYGDAVRLSRVDRVAKIRAAKGMEDGLCVASFVFLGKVLRRAFCVVRRFFRELLAVSYRVEFGVAYGIRFSVFVYGMVS